MTRPYRPEGDALWAFEQCWCDRCQSGPIDVTVCPIWARAMAYQPGAPNFPAAWVVNLDGPRCTTLAARDAGPAPVPVTDMLFERRL